MAFPLLQPKSDPPKGGNLLLDSSKKPVLTPEKNQKQDSSKEVNNTSNEEYVRFQQRTLILTLIVSAFSVAISAIFFDNATSLSVLIGAFSGILYLRLLARTIGKLGTSSKTVGKFQLLVPVLLILVVTRFPQLHLLPALLAFLLYKPSLVLQALLEF